MRILHTADLQLGSGRTLTEDRLADQGRMLAQIVEIAKEQAVELVIVGGDVYEHRSPSRDADEVFLAFLVQLAQAAIPVLIVGGNHDFRGFERASTIGIFRELGVDVALTPQVRCYGDVAVCCLPWIHPGQLAASRNGGDQDVLSADVADLLVEAARDLYAQADEWTTKLLAAHWAVSGASLPTGIPTDELREPVIPLPDLQEIGFDYIALGHIHRAQMLSIRPAPVAWYAGSPWVNDWGEAKGEHGVVLIDTVADSVRWELIEDMAFVTLNADLDPMFDRVTVNDFLFAETTRPGIDGAIVRLRYTATAEQARRIDQAKIKLALYDAGAYHVSKIEPTIVREDRARVEGVTEDLSPMDAHRMYCEFQDVPWPLAERMTGLLGELLAKVSA
jgi:exonuclease SbcD